MYNPKRKMYVYLQQAGHHERNFTVYVAPNLKIGNGQYVFWNNLVFYVFVKLDF